LFILVSLTLHGLHSDYPDFQIILESLFFSLGMVFLAGTISYAVTANGAKRPKWIVDGIAKHRKWIEFAFFVIWVIGYLAFWGRLDLILKQQLYSVAILVVGSVVFVSALFLPKE
jgi:hypothetical protein